MKKILIIEDDGNTLELLGIIAKGYDHEIILKSEVLSVAEIDKIKPDLIILDQWIGSALGSELCLAIKQNETTKEIPVVLISAITEIGQFAMDNGADGCILKPFNIEEIQEVIETYIE